MVYTDGVHLVADTLGELHKFAFSIGLKYCYFEGTRKGHPHYDLLNWKKKALWCGETKQTFIKKAYEAGAMNKDRKEILRISQDMLIDKTQTEIKFQ